MLVTYELGTLKLIYLPGFITNAELSVVLMPNAFTVPGFRESLSLHCEIVRDMPPLPPTRTGDARGRKRIRLSWHFSDQLSTLPFYVRLYYKYSLTAKK